MEWAVLLSYLLAPAALTLVGAPIAAWFFQDLPRNGAAFALPAALVPFTIAVFWIGQVTFGLHTLVLGVAVVAGCAVVASRAGGSPQWRSVLGGFGVFTVGFLVMVGFRAADPGITPAGGEQFLHFGIVTAIERADSLPPEDMWFAGRALKYYYGTQLQVASLAMLTGTPLRYGFNLGLATFYGVLFVVAYGLGGAIVHRQGRAHPLGGVLAVFFVALAGPTTTAIRFAVPYLPDAIAARVEPAAFGFVARRFNEGNMTTTVAELSKPADWGWWYTRYVVPGTLHEVPLYAFVKADLHGHTFANGYVLLAGALAFASYVAPPTARWRRRGIVFGGLGAVAGLFGVMNTWALPTAAGLAVLGVAAADAHPAALFPRSWESRLRPAPPADRDRRLGRVAEELWRLVLAGLAGVGVLVIGIAIAAPFLVFGQVPTNEGIGVFPPRSPLGPFLVIYAGLLTVFALAVWMPGGAVRADVPDRWLVVGGLCVTAAAVAAYLVDFAVLAVLGPLLLAGWLLVRTERGGFALVLLIAGTGLLLSFELVHARLPLIDNPRWNTSLKVAIQGWTLAAGGAGAATAILLASHASALGRVGGWEVGDQEASTAPSVHEAAHRTGSGDPSMASRIRPTLRSASVVAILLVVVLASAVFPVMMVSTEVAAEIAQDRYDPSLDGHTAAERWHAGEYAALVWLNDRPGTPTLVEAPGRSYDWTSPAATFSGLPAVVGWDHEAEYRSPEAYQRRVDHVDAIYTGNWSAAARYLDRYDVTYVYVGPNERGRYGTRLRSFDREAFSVAFAEDGVTIYRVDLQ